MPAQQPPDFYDVFISYRHRDEAAVRELEANIRGLGFESFLDFNFPSLADAGEVTPEKVEAIRQAIARATCLIFAYSRRSAQEEAAKQSTEPSQPEESPVGLWMPWELGFFDGSLASYRIAVYLLDGTPEDFDPKRYFHGSEYLQLYPAVTEAGREPRPGEGAERRTEKLSTFLGEHAVRERRVDNVASAFTWFEHLAEECLANPTNVAMGLAEWQAEHIARFWEQQGNPDLADRIRQWKDFLDHSRMTWMRALRMPMIDAILASAHSQRQLATRGLVRAASVVARPKLAQSGEPEPAKAWGDVVASSLQPLGWPSSLTSQSRPWTPLTTERGNIEGLVTEPGAGRRRP